jgi:putative tryptophan/tyrosine transport system substrate-binding protein
MAALPAMGRAQRRLWRIAYHSAGSASTNAGWLDAFRSGMARLGWSEASHYVIDARYADGDASALRRLAAEIVVTQPDVILTVADDSIVMLASLTKTIPIVFAIGADPVATGYVASLQRPGGNVTGIGALTGDLAAKRLELLKDTLPQLSHVVALFQPTDVAALSQIKTYQAIAPKLGVRLSLAEIRQASDIEAAFRKRGALPDAYVIASGFMLNIHRKAIAEHLLRARSPSIASSPLYADAGILMSYAPSFTGNFARAAGYVDRILKGANPGELAIELPTKFELVINAGTAKALGINIPQSVLVRADRIIQ